MKSLILTCFAISTLVSCSLKKTADNTDTLPKDIALKPEIALTQEQERENMAVLIKEIDSIISKESCTDASEWKFTAIGSKPCGGPSSYIAYPVKMQEEILSKVSDFTAMQSAFNLKYGLMSDCAIVPAPVEIKCEDGKAILFGGNLEKEIAE